MEQFSFIFLSIRVEKLYFKICRFANTPKFTPNRFLYPLQAIPGGDYLCLFSRQAVIITLHPGSGILFHLIACVGVDI